MMEYYPVLKTKRNLTHAIMNPENILVKLACHKGTNTVCLYLYKVLRVAQFEKGKHSGNELGERRKAVYQTPFGRMERFWAGMLVTAVQQWQCHNADLPHHHFVKSD